MSCESLIVAVDHKTLLGLFGNRSLDNVPNNRLRNLKERTLRYRFTMQHIPGRKNCAPDSVPRYPSGNHEPDRMHLPDDVASSSDQHSPLIKLIPPIAHQIFNGSSQLATATIENSDKMEDGIRSAAISAITSLQSVKWDAIGVATTSDNDMQHLVSIIESGFLQSLWTFHLVCGSISSSVSTFLRLMESLYTETG